MSIISPLQMACHIHDRGWVLAEHRQDGNHLYASPQRPFMQGVDLETAYGLQKSQEDKMGDKIPLEEAKRQLNQIEDGRS